MNLIKVFRAVPELLISYNILKTDVEASLKDPAVRQAVDRLKSDPALALTFPRISGEWRAVEEAINRMR